MPVWSRESISAWRGLQGAECRAGGKEPGQWRVGRDYCDKTSEQSEARCFFSYRDASPQTSAQTGAKAAVSNNKVSKVAVGLALQRGLKVRVYTFNDPAEANRLLDMES